MAIRKIRERIRNADGTYDIKYRETSGDMVVGPVPEACKATTRLLVGCDFLNVDLSGNFKSENMKPSMFGSDLPADFINSPYTAGPFYGYREVFTAKHLTVVQVTEAYPITGRVWSNTYDPNAKTWYGWKQNGNSALDAYPVGAVYMSAASTSPASLFGGQWSKLENRFLLAAGSAYPVGSMGGEGAVVLGAQHMANHYHDGITIDSRTVGVGTGGNELGIAFVAGNLSSRLITSPTGNMGNQPHNNMPPYYAVYMWQRIG